MRNHAAHYRHNAKDVDEEQPCHKQGAHAVVWYVPTSVFVLVPSSRSWECLRVAACAGVSPKVCEGKLGCLLVILRFLLTVGVSPEVGHHVVDHGLVALAVANWW